jgi:hypothetical protein
MLACQGAVEMLWAGERDYFRLCVDMERGDVGSHYCVLRMLELCAEMGISLESKTEHPGVGAGARAGGGGGGGGGGVRAEEEVRREAQDGMAKLFGSGDLKLLGQHGKTTAVRELAAYQVVGVFFSGHWCPPSRQFTPMLTRAYTAMRAAGKSIEIVFISCDHDIGEFASYFKETPDVR